MSKKIICRLRYILLAMAVGIVAVQVVYAAVWAILNGNNIQDFYDTAIYLRSAQSFTSDGWRLAGYACILRLFMGIKGVLGDYYVLPLYLMQLACSTVSFAYAIKIMAKVFWDRICTWKVAMAGATYLVTLPVVWQMQFAVLPDAFCLALLVLLFSQILLLLFEKEEMKWERLWIVTGALLLLGVMHHHYFYGGVCLVVIAIIGLFMKQVFRKYRSKAGITITVGLAIVLLLTCGICFGVNASIPQEETYAKHTFAAELWSRFVYPHGLEDFASYPEEVRNVIASEVSMTGKEPYEYYMTDLMPALENGLNEDATHYVGEMAKQSFLSHRNEAIKSFIKEGVAYAFMPVAVVKYMYQNGGSLYGHNLIKMWEKSPKLTTDYMHICMNGFLMMCGLGSILFLSAVVAKEIKIRQGIKVVLAAGLSIVGVTLPIMLFAFEKFDYRVGLFSVFVWGASVVSLMIGKEWRKKDECRCIE